MTLVTGCGDSNSSNVLPTSPSAVTGPPASTSPTEDGTNGTGTTGGSSAVQRCGRDDLRMAIYVDSGQFRPSFSGNSITLAVENVSQSACELTFTSWDRNNGSSIVLTDGQVLVDGQRYLVPAGQRVVMGPLRVPEGCYQLDVSNAGGQPIPDRADRLDAIRWHTGGTCRPSPPPGQPDPRECTTGLSLTASYANGLVTLQSATSAAVSSRALRVWHRTDQGPIVEASAMLGQPATLPFAQDQQAHTMAVRASYVGDDRATCSAETTVVIPPGPPPSATCANTTTDLGLFTNPPSASQVTGYLLTTLTGDGIAGQLTVDGTVTTATHGARTPFTFERPPAGSPAVVKVATLRSTVNGEACGERTVRITLEPRAAAVCSGVVVGLALAPDAPTATAISGHLVSTLRGTGVTGELVLDGVTTHPADGEQTPYRFDRPGVGVPPVVRTATLRGLVGGEVCGVQSVTITAPPQAATCENSVTRLQLVPGVMSATAVTGTLRTTVQGPGTTGVLTRFDGASVPAADNGSVPYTIARPPYGSQPLRLTATLQTSTNGSACGSDSVTLDVPPQDPPAVCSIKEGLDAYAGPSTPTEVTGHYQINWRGGTGVVGHLTLPDGTTIVVSNGDQVPYRYARPPAGSEMLVVWATLRTSTGATPCGEATHGVRVPAQDQ